LFAGRCQDYAFDIRNGLLGLLENSLANTRLVDQEAVNPLESLGEGLEVVDDADVFGALREDVQVNETERVLVLSENRDDAEVFLLSQVDPGVEAARELWNCRGRV
jgi:hypothetical protein